MTEPGFSIEAHYHLAFAFWSKLATESAVIGSSAALANTEVPYFLSNAAWYPDTATFTDLISWYETRELPPAVILSGGSGWRGRLESSGFRHELSFAFEVTRLSTEAPQDQLVEQVSWAQARTLAEILARHYDQPAFTLPISKGLARLLEQNEAVTAFIAYAEEAVGATVTFQHEDTLVAMLSGGETTALCQRLHFEADSLRLRQQLLRPFAEGEKGLERWVYTAEPST